MFTKEDADFMRLAIATAQKSLYLSNPNPRVGCVIVKAGQVIGTGFTQQVGLAHAEIEALADAHKHSADLSGSTMYVSLEPCCHVGRTPPCTQAIITAKPARVVIAMQDPNSRVSEHRPRHCWKVHSCSCCRRAQLSRPIAGWVFAIERRRTALYAP